MDDFGNLKTIKLRAIDQERLGFSVVFVNTSDPVLLAECLANAKLIRAAFEANAAVEALAKARVRHE